MTTITGDSIIGGEFHLDPLLDLIRGLRHKPVYLVNGNHEWATGDCTAIERHASSAGAVLLDNRAVRLRRGASHIWLLGVDDPITGHARLDRAVAGTKGAAPRILLAHAPIICPEANEEGIDLVLAGHTHGGQVRLPLAGALYVSRLGYFPHWSYGFYRMGTTGMVVNAGLGETSAFRFNIDPEVVLVTLTAAGGDMPESDLIADAVTPLKRKVKSILQRSEQRRDVTP